jgi:hypothetical protein
MTNTNMKTLRERAKEISNSLPLMEGREKGEIDRIVNDNITIKEYGFMSDTDNEGKEKEYVAFVVAEDPDHFYFGGQVLTEHMRQFENDGFHEAIVEEGLPVLLGKKKRKKKREYTTVEFYPET